MRWLVFSALFLPALALANKVVTLTLTPTYAISVTDAQLICTSLYANLPAAALANIERLAGTPYSCLFDNSSGKNQIKLTFTVKEISST